MVFEETKEVCKRIINKKEREICEFDAKFKKCFFVGVLIYDDIVS